MEEDALVKVTFRDGVTVGVSRENVDNITKMAALEGRNGPISNTYLSRMADSIEEVYRCIQMYVTEKQPNANKVVMLGGYIESVKRRKEKEELAGLYQLAKEGQMNTQGFVIQMLAISDLPKETKEQLAQSFDQDPFKSPQVIQLQGMVQKLNQTIQQQNTQIALLRLQATQRLERQKEFIDSTERTKRLEIAQKQWSEEQKQTQEALMAILNDCLAKSDYDGAIRVVEEIKQQSAPLISDSLINAGANAFSDENAKSVQTALDEKQGVQGSRRLAEGRQQAQRLHRTPDRFARRLQDVAETQEAGTCPAGTREHPA